MNTGKHIQEQLSGVSWLSGLGVTRTALKRHRWAWPIFAALLFGGVGRLVHRSVEDAMREKLADDLTTILNADVEALRLWAKDQTAIARALAGAADARRDHSAIEVQTIVIETVVLVPEASAAEVVRFSGGPRLAQIDHFIVFLMDGFPGGIVFTTIIWAFGEHETAMLAPKTAKL